MATHSSILVWKIPLRGAWQAIVHGVVNYVIRKKNKGYALIQQILIVFPLRVLWERQRSSDKVSSWTLREKPEVLGELRRAQRQRRPSMEVTFTGNSEGYTGIAWKGGDKLEIPAETGLWRDWPQFSVVRGLCKAGAVEVMSTDKMPQTEMGKAIGTWPFRTFLFKLKNSAFNWKGSREPWKVKKQIKNLICAAESSLCQQCPEEMDTSSRNKRALPSGMLGLFCYSSLLLCRLLCKTLLIYSWDGPSCYLHLPGRKWGSVTYSELSSHPNSQFKLFIHPCWTRAAYAFWLNSQVLWGGLEACSYWSQTLLVNTTTTPCDGSKTFCPTEWFLQNWSRLPLKIEEGMAPAQNTRSLSANLTL